MTRANSPTFIAIRDLIPAYVGLFLLSAFLPIFFLVGPLFGYLVSSRVLPSRSLSSLAVLVIIALFLMVMGAIIDHIREKALGRIGIALDARLSKAFFATLHREDAANRLTATTLADLDFVREFLTGRVVTGLFDALWSPVLIACLFMIHWLYGAVSLAAILILSGLSLFNQWVVREDSSRYLKVAGATSEFGAALSRNSETARALGMMPPLRDRWHLMHSAMLGWREEAGRRAGIVRSASRFVQASLYVAVFAVGALLVMAEQVDQTAMFIAMMLIMRGVYPIEALISNWEAISRFAPARHRLDAAFLGAERAQRISLPRPDGPFIVSRIWGAAPGSDKVIISDVSFTVYPGRVLAIVGPSGAGKSCLARLLVNIWTPRRGTISLGDHDFTHWNPDELGRLVGYVPQDVEFMPGTVAQNIARFDPVQCEDTQMLVEAVEIAGVQDVIRSLPDGFNTPIGPGGYVLSGGQRQRIAMARAVFGDPYLIVMDEPNANLDSVGEQALGSAIQRLRSGEKVVILVTHRMSLLAFCDDLLVLNGGAVQAHGDRDNIVNRLPRLKATPALTVIGGDRDDREA
ncbi:MAG: hypothetical protein B7Y12_14610 [Rhizobiales bacterium 24-66-13]|jgi:PrtD family type I secretion system ABC transporter|uniref:type I secretion system permease/ATPase n=1 Tax=Roseixanthobacter finlandensis TaxID=3119922 RepID=UPI000BD1B840|nr:MAG: hypothetical protein B7Y61_06050 [Rhizobiales bacterium 35-66-30]OYZ73858.1 MAG: hypothetical protein B7Y12_14610 [Rhizobiales bacterium 24-66-13]HQS11079.1 ATP-binding cassette domain-containing protein [Xanthobacteraceae bacterium]